MMMLVVAGAGTFVNTDQPAAAKTPFVNTVFVSPATGVKVKMNCPPNCLTVEIAGGSGASTVNVATGELVMLPATLVTTTVKPPASLSRALAKE